MTEIEARNSVVNKYSNIMCVFILSILTPPIDIVVDQTGMVFDIHHPKSM